MAEGRQFEVIDGDSSAAENLFSEYSKFGSTVSAASSVTDLSSTLGEARNLTGGQKKKKMKSHCYCCFQRKKVFRALECVVLGFVVFVIAALFALPTLFFAWQPTQETVESNVTLSSSDVCLEPAVYTGATCRAELQIYQECFSGSAGSNGDIFIRSDIDQETVEGDAELLIEGGLSFLNPSAECLAAIRPFLCLHLFGVCDSGNQLRQVSSSECVDLRDNICVREWSAAIGFLGAGTLPVCEELSGDTGSCVEVEDGSASAMNEMSSTTDLEGSAVFAENGTVNGLAPSNESVVCSGGFYLNDDGMCRPLCGDWEDFDREEVVTILACCIDLICAIAVFTLAFTIQRSTMLVFPTFYLLYLTTTAAVIGAVVLMGYTSKAYFFCSSVDLIHSINSPTHFCNLSGIVYNYGLLQLSLWTVYHVAALFWSIRFPFHYRNFKAKGYFKYIHVITVAVAVLVPLIPALAPLKDGYIPVGQPPIVCSVENADYNYYMLVLPVSILLATTSCFLVLVFWTILKELVLKKLAKRKSFSKAGMAELKISIIFIHYILLGVIGLVIFTMYIATQEQYSKLYQEYFLCESLGMKHGLQCPGADLFRAQIINILSYVAIMLLGLVPFTVLIFTGNFKALREACQKNKKHSRSTFRSTRTTSSSNV